MVTKRLTKSQELLYYLIDKHAEIDDKTKLAKLQYFTDFIHFAFNDSPVSEKNYIYTRQKFGALARSFDIDIEELKKAGLIVEQPKYHYKTIKDLKVTLSAAEKKTANYVLRRYGQNSYAELVDICHNQAPYLSARNGEIIEFFTAYNLVDEYPDYASSN